MTGAGQPEERPVALPPDSRAWIEVDGGALVANAAFLSERVGAARLIPMVKADGYGLGAVETVRALARLRPWGYGVATVDEGILLREAGVRAPLLVAAPVLPGETKVALRYDLDCSVSSLAEIDSLAGGAAETGVRSLSPGVHVEVDTGMGRAGFDWRKSPGWLAEAFSRIARSRLRLAGLFSHLHSADESEEAIREQERRFRPVAAQVAGSTMLHLLNSAGILRASRYSYDAVRPGIFLYGGSPASDLPSPVPVASVRARVARVREARAGDSAGYNATYVAEGDERWATLAIGYGDGLPRSVSNRGYAVIDGRRSPIVGRTSMDVTVVRVDAATRVAPGDVATLIGRDGDESVPLHEVADLAGTIPYEILTGFSPRLPRVWKRPSPPNRAAAHDPSDAEPQPEDHGR